MRKFTISCVGCLCPHTTIANILRYFQCCHRHIHSCFMYEPFPFFGPWPKDPFFSFDSFNALVVQNVVLQIDIGLRVCRPRARLKISKYNGETGVQNCGYYFRIVFFTGKTRVHLITNTQGLTFTLHTYSRKVHTEVLRVSPQLYSELKATIYLADSDKLAVIRAQRHYISSFSESTIPECLHSFVASSRHYIFSGVWWASGTASSKPLYV